MVGLAGRHEAGMRALRRAISTSSIAFLLIAMRRSAGRAGRRELNQKQAVRHAFDEEIIAWAREREGLADCEVLHPSLMYQLFWPIFQGRLPVGTMLHPCALRALSEA